MTYMQLDAEDRLLFSATIERLAMLSNGLEGCKAGQVECSAAEWSVFAEHGLLGLGVPPVLGGVGGGAQDLALVMRDIGRNLLAFPFLDTVVIAGRALLECGSDSQKQMLLPAIAEGRLRIGFAHREPDAGDARDHVEARAQDDRLTGTKTYVFDGRSADQFLVSARDANGSLRLFLVDRNEEGLSLQHYRLPDNRTASQLTLHGVRAEPLGGDASDSIAAIFELATVCVAAETIGAIEMINAQTLDYAKTRRQFGQPIGSFQVIQHRLVDMFIAEQTAAAAVADALTSIDAGLAASPVLVSGAKAQSDRSGRMVGESAIQIHGGMGMTNECAVGHYLKRVLTNGSRFGTAGSHVARIAAAAMRK